MCKVNIAVARNINTLAHGFADVLNTRLIRQHIRVTDQHHGIFLRGFLDLRRWIFLRLGHFRLCFGIIRIDFRFLLRLTGRERGFEFAVQTNRNRIFDTGRFQGHCVGIDTVRRHDRIAQFRTLRTLDQHGLRQTRGGLAGKRTRERQQHGAHLARDDVLHIECFGGEIQ